MGSSGTITLITDTVDVVEGAIEDGKVWIEAAGLAAATGWEHKPIGLCRDDQCIPTELNPGLVDATGRVDLEVLATLSDQIVVVDAEESVVVLGANAAARTRELASGAAPAFTLPTLAGDPVSLDDFRGGKTLVVAFASWCGCAYELPAWQELHRELAPDGFNLVAIAIDEEVDAVQPFVEGIEFPVLIDRDRTFATSYALTNVPTVVWIDEDGRIARPHGVAFGSDQFKEFHKIESDPHHDALRRWVRDGEAPDAPETADDEPWQPTAAEQVAHLEYRLALHLWRAGEEDKAIAHFDHAAELAPLDFTVRRAQLPLRGKDPFLGEEFLELYAEWEQAGSPYYGRTS